MKRFIVVLTTVLISLSAFAQERADSAVVWESPDPSEMKIEVIEENEWWTYSKNGVNLAFFTAVIRDYGKYHAVTLIIENKSDVAIEFDPVADISVTSINHKKGEETTLKVMSSDEYLEKYDRVNAIGSTLFTIREAAALVEGGIQKDKSVSLFDAYLSWDLANTESQRFESQVQELRELIDMGYMHKTTVDAGQAMTGTVYVPWIKGDEVTVNININGAVYPFTWDTKKKRK